MTRLTPADIAAIAEAVARRLQSGRPSSAGIAAVVEGDDQCDECTDLLTEESDTVESDTESSSLRAAAEIGRQAILRLQRGLKPKPAPRAPAQRNRARR